MTTPSPDRLAALLDDPLFVRCTETEAMAIRERARASVRWMPLPIVGYGLLTLAALGWWRGALGMWQFWAAGLVVLGVVGWLLMHARLFRVDQRVLLPYAPMYRTPYDEGPLSPFTELNGLMFMAMLRRTLRQDALAQAQRDPLFHQWLAHFLTSGERWRFQMRDFQCLEQHLTASRERVPPTGPSEPAATAG